MYSVAQLKMDNPRVSFPSTLTDATLIEWSMYPATVAAKPAYDPITQAIEKSEPQNVDGAWVISWSIQQLPQEKAETNVRNRRNSLLSDCDWTQLSDASVDSLAWANYRQELRDITDQAGFPYNVNWPTPPV